MEQNFRKKLSWLILAILIVVSIFQIKNGNLGFGIGLLVGCIGASIGRIIKQNKIKKLQEKGLNPYDERAFFIAGKASYATLSSTVILSALFVLLGSILGPQLNVNPYNFLGNCLAIIVFIYIAFYYYYNRNM